MKLGINQELLPVKVTNILNTWTKGNVVGKYCFWNNGQGFLHGCPTFLSPIKYKDVLSIFQRKTNSSTPLKKKRNLVCNTGPFLSPLFRCGSRHPLPSHPCQAAGHQPFWSGHCFCRWNLRLKEIRGNSEILLWLWEFNPDVFPISAALWRNGWEACCWLAGWLSWPTTNSFPPCAPLVRFLLSNPHNSSVDFR